jgi:hypothetical protein
MTQHMSSLLSFPLSFFISSTCRDKLVSWLKIWLIPELDSPIGDDSSFMAISNASAYEAIFYCIRGTLMCGRRETMNYSLLCSSGIWKVNQPIKVLNLWSNSHTGSTTFCLISFISVIHCGSDLGFLNSPISVLNMIQWLRLCKSLDKLHVPTQCMDLWELYWTEFFWQLHMWHS